VQHGATPIERVTIAARDLPEAGAAAGRVCGELAAGEDAGALARTLVVAPRRVLDGHLTLLTHADLEPTATTAQRADQRDAKLAALRAGGLNRYVFLLETAAGRRIVKIAEVTRLGNSLLGALGSSVPRREHALHQRAQVLELAASETRGFLEWRQGLRLRRACQLQSPLDPDAVTLSTFLTAELSRHGDVALERFAEALARTHARRFFHADLKGFHAVVSAVARPATGPATYDLRWIDLARVSFHLTPRKRLINLYQALRFVVPRRPEAEERFIRAYCAASGWQAASPEKALARVRSFLAYKYRTYPLP
jgi:hypothetical protein